MNEPDHTVSKARAEEHTEPAYHDDIPAIPLDIVGDVTEDGIVTITDTSDDSGDAWITYEPHTTELKELNRR